MDRNNQAFALYLYGFGLLYSIYITSTNSFHPNDSLSHNPL